MTRTEILELAKQAGCAFNQIMFGRTDYCVMTEFEFERFAQLVAAREREACAKLLENGVFLHDQSPAKLLANEAAKAIRSRT